MKSVFTIISIFFFICFFTACIDSESDQTNDLKSNLIDTKINQFKDKSKPENERRNDLKKAYGIISTLPDNSFKIEKLREISIGHYTLKDFELYKDMNYRALRLSKKLGDSLGMAKFYGLLGIYYRERQLDSAYKNFYDAEKIYASFDESLQRDPISYAYDHGKILIDIAKISRKVKDYSKSEALTIEAIKKFKLSGNEKYLHLCYINLGIISKYIERYEDAVNYHLKSIEYSEVDNRKVKNTVFGYSNIGTVYKSNKRYEKAKEYYKKALSYKEYLNENPKTYSRLLDNLTYVNFLSGNKEGIPDNFYKSLRIRDSLNDRAGISTNSLHLAEYYQSIGKDSIAKTYAEKAKDISLELNNNEELLKSYEILSDVSESNIGLTFAQAHIRLSDSLQREERLFKDKFARIRFETAEKEEKISKISRENQILLFAILGLSILFLLGYIIFRQQQNNKELLFEQKQQQSNQEIYRLLLSQQVKLEEGRKLEQQRMSEELHDGVLGRLFGVRLSLDGINQRANDGFTDARTKYIEELKSIEREIRLISHDLGTEMLSPEIAYVDVVESLVSDLCQAHEIEFEFANDENIDWELVDNQKKVNLFRIIQESLQNIFKHAQAKSVKINFDYVDDKINLTILDDGIGFKSSKVKRGIGLKNITSRVKQMNGVVDFVNNTESTGTTVSVGVPM